MQEQEVLYQKDDGWGLCPYLVKYTRDGQQHEQLTDDAEWFRRFEEQWVDFRVEEVIELNYTQGQLDRLDEIQGVKARYFDELYDYVINGIIKVESEVFAEKNIAKLKKENTMLEGTIMELANALAMAMGGVI